MTRLLHHELDLGRDPVLVDPGIEDRVLPDWLAKTRSVVLPAQGLVGEGEEFGAL